MKTKLKLLADLEEDLGSDLFQKLSDSDKNFIIKTTGTLDFGKAIDLEKFNRERRKDG